MSKSRTTGFAIASLVLGIFGITIIGAILAIIFGIIALNKINKNKKIGGKSMAIVGIVLGSIICFILFSSVIIGFISGDDIPIDVMNESYDNFSSDGEFEETDNFSNAQILHWSHMPITYKFENYDFESNYSRQVNLTRSAFKKVEDETSEIIWFREVIEDPDISIYFKPSVYDRSGEYALGVATKSELDLSKNLILKGKIEFYGQGAICSTGYPVLEVHEILHLFDISHNPKTNSIMFPYSADSSRKCKITKIDEEYISCLMYTYSNGTVPGDCNFPNFFEEEESECSDGWYEVKGSEYCCPEPGMIIVDDYCVY
ncbi:DUF4190 domain-containing protein [archaeon]|nr:DUF4190 domain-containing protein [archaeon]MBT7106743.1 DUF4190 domain-containing protein [archaeon]MBT7297563.1 DUF4190 domain-containing protein [archaeon]